MNKNELKEIIENLEFKLPKDLNIPIIINHGNNIKNYLKKIINQHGEILLTGPREKYNRNFGPKKIKHSVI